MAAGLAAQSAEADFTFSYTYSSVAAYAYGGDGFATYDSFLGAGFWSILAEDTATGGFAAGASEGTALSIRLNADVTFGTAYASLPVSYFTVTSDVTADVSWSFDVGIGTVKLLNITDNIDLVNEDLGAGATTVSLEAGKEYSLSAAALAFGGIDGKAFVEIIIPAPPAALPLLAAGGLMTVSRRRRRE